MKRRTGRLAVSIAGTAATLLLHSMLVAVALWGGGSPNRHPDRPDAIGAGANTGQPEGESTERRMTIHLLTTAASEPSYVSTDRLLEEMVRDALQLEITGPDALPLPPLMIQEDGDPAESTDAELMARSRMAGIYQSQIRARIERAWTLPEGSAEGVNFSCRALIRQQRDGRIKEVELPYDGCGESAAMRQSLIDAIFTASPLPAPPHPGVFVETFSLELHTESVRGR